MHYSCNKLLWALSGRPAILRLALILAIMAMSIICYAQDVPQNTIRRVEKFSFSFEPDEVVELDLTTASPDEVGSDAFLTLVFFNSSRTQVLRADFDLSRLPLIRVAATRTGYGKANLTINGVSGGLVPVRRDRIYLFVQALVNSTGRDYETDELIFIPSETSLRGLMTFVDKDGGRRTQSVVTTSMKVPVSE